MVLVHGDWAEVPPPPSGVKTAALEAGRQERSAKTSARPMPYEALMLGLLVTREIDRHRFAAGRTATEQAPKDQHCGPVGRDSMYRVSKQGRA